MVKFLLRKLFWGFFRHLLSDKWYTMVRYWLELDKWPNIKHPKKFSEKIQYIKLYEKSELRRTVANRNKVRNYVDEKVGSEYLIPLIGIYKELTPDIWESLPKKFVLKANHGSGMLKIVFDKTQEDYSVVYNHTEKWKKFDYAQFGREWAYKSIPKTIVAEELLLDSNQSIPDDYKFFCFHGRVELIQVDVARFNNHKRVLFDRDFKKINAKLLHPRYEGTLERPSNLCKAIEVAELLSSDFNFIRVDLYLLENKIYFGELTNYPGSGFEPFEPNSMDYNVGKLLKL